MKYSLGAAFLASIVALGLVVPVFAQSPQPIAPQDNTTSSTVFLPLVTVANAQVDSTDDDLPAEALLTEEELLQQYGSQVQAAAVIATNGKIAFSSNLDGDGDIYAMNADGTGLVNLTNNALGLHQTEPKWSPDGTKIAFVMGSALNDAGIAQGFIGVMNGDGSNATFLTLSGSGGGTDFQPEWSPDGTKIAFTTRREGDFDIYIMNADGSNPHNMFVSEPGGFGQPNETNVSWSPDGTKLLYMSTNSLLATNIATLDAAGIGPQSLLTRAIGVEYGEPEWSPDGQLITYLHYANLPELWVMHADGTNQTQVVPANVVNLQAPAFAPDGKLLTVIGQPAGVAGASKELFALPAPVAPLSVPVVTPVTATRLTTTGGVGSADWQKKLVTAQSLTVRTVSQKGGMGIVTSQPSGINCGAQCTMTLAAGTKVTLTAVPQAGAKFVKWAGACTGKALTCQVTVNKARLAIAYFKQQ